MIHINIDLTSADDLDAFGDFAKSLANKYRENPPANPYVQQGLIGGIGGAMADAGNFEAINPPPANAAEPEDAESTSEVSVSSANTADEANDTVDADKRPIGKPSGSTRRTKAEIAEDEELQKFAKDAGVEPDDLDSVIAEHGRNAALKALQAKLDAANSGEINQDAADEAAENAQEETATLTVDDLRSAMTAYANKFGMEEVQEDGPKIMVAALGEPPADPGVWKLSIVAAAGDDKVAKAAKAWKAAAEADTRYGAA